MKISKLTCFKTPLDISRYYMPDNKRKKYNLTDLVLDFFYSDAKIYCLTYEVNDAYKNSDSIRDSVKTSIARLKLPIKIMKDGDNIYLYKP